MNLFRGNVAEHGLGHYEVPRAHILSSLIYLDEVHLGVRLNSLSDALLVMSRLGTSLVLATATLGQRQALSLVQTLRGGGASVRHIVVAKGSLDGVEVCMDNEFFSAVEAVEWHYKPLQSFERALHVVEEESSTGKRVFFAVATPEEAVRAWRHLAARLGAENVAVLHGRMAPLDRKTTLDNLDRVKVLVGTSAVEAGVDADFDILVSTVGGVVDLPSLIQRMGRVCRKPWLRPCEEALVYLVGDKAEEYARLLEDNNVNPRVPDTYRRLLDEDEYTRDSGHKQHRLARIVLGLMLLTPNAVDELLHKLCDLVREEPLIPIIPRMFIDDIREGRLAPEDAMVTVGLGWLRDPERRKAVLGDAKRVDILVYSAKDGQYSIVTREVSSWGCREVTRLLTNPVSDVDARLLPVGLVAEVYRRGEGLVLV